jgi:hypothetical protein
METNDDIGTSVAKGRYAAKHLGIRMAGEVS